MAWRLICVCARKRQEERTRSEDWVPVSIQVEEQEHRRSGKAAASEPNPAPRRGTRGCTEGAHWQCWRQRPACVTSTVARVALSRVGQCARGLGAGRAPAPSWHCPGGLPGRPCQQAWAALQSLPGHCRARATTTGLSISLALNSPLQKFNF